MTQRMSRVPYKYSACTGHRRPYRPDDGQQLESTAMRKPVLVVDDDPDIRQVLQDRLESYGYPIANAPDGRAALKILESLVPRGLFLDIRMPGMDGLEVLARIRELHPSIPVVIITAASAGANVAEALRAGAQAYLLKPFDTVQIKQVAEHWFGIASGDEQPG